MKKAKGISTVSFKRIKKEVMNWIEDEYVYNCVRIPDEGSLKIFEIEAYPTHGETRRFHEYIGFDNMHEIEYEMSAVQQEKIRVAIVETILKHMGYEANSLKKLEEAK